MKARNWILGWLGITVVGLAVMGFGVYKIDPYMHYHKPDTNKYFYELNNERSQNDGITRHFDYDALITGTSMTENFKTSEMDELFGCHSIKVSYSGAPYKEINDNLKVAVASQPNLKLVVRGLDINMFFDDADRVRTDQGTYPTYLYDNNPLNDVQYLLNRDVIWDRAYAMTISDHASGITSFDDYAAWQNNYSFGIDAVCPEGIHSTPAAEQEHLTDEEKVVIEENIRKNVTSLADENPSITFHYYFTPYSISYWNTLMNQGKLEKQLEAEAYIIKLIIGHENIHLHSIQNRMDIITDLNNYKDTLHYGQWINSLPLHWMYTDQYRLTKENYQAYLAEEKANYLNYDYASISNQEDYEADYYAAALLSHELTGTSPLKINEHNISLSNTEATSFQFDLENIDIYQYLVFNGKSLSKKGTTIISVISEQGDCLKKLEINHKEINKKSHQYVIDLSDVSEAVTLLFEGGAVEESEAEKSGYLFHDITLY